MSRFIDDKKNVMIAVTQNGQALQYVEEGFQTEEPYNLFLALLKGGNSLET